MTKHQDRMFFGLLIMAAASLYFLLSMLMGPIATDVGLPFEVGFLWPVLLPIAYVVGWGIERGGWA